MLRYVVEQGQTKGIKLYYTDISDNPTTPTTFQAIVTEQATDTVVKTISEYDVLDTGTIAVYIDTQDLNVGRHFITFKATMGDYQQEDVVVFDIQNHEGK